MDADREVVRVLLSCLALYMLSSSLSPSCYNPHSDHPSSSSLLLLYPTLYTYTCTYTCTFLLLLSTQDIAMTRLFGSNSVDFYDTYNTEWALPEGWQERQVVYNAYHILNHFVLFGGGYLQQGKSMLERVLTF